MSLWDLINKICHRWKYSQCPKSEEKHNSSWLSKLNLWLFLPLCRLFDPLFGLIKLILSLTMGVLLKVNFFLILYENIKLQQKLYKELVDYRRWNLIHSLLTYNYTWLAVIWVTFFQHCRKLQYLWHLKNYYRQVAFLCEVWLYNIRCEVWITEYILVGTSFIRPWPSSNRYSSTDTNGHSLAGFYCYMEDAPVKLP